MLVLVVSIKYVYSMFNTSPIESFGYINLKSILTRVITDESFLSIGSNNIHLYTLPPKWY